MLSPLYAGGPKTLTCEGFSGMLRGLLGLQRESTNWKTLCTCYRQFEKCVLLEHTLTFDLWPNLNYPLQSWQSRYLGSEGTAAFLSYSVVYNCSWSPDLQTFIFPIADPRLSVVGCHVACALIGTNCNTVRATARGCNAAIIRYL